MRVLLLIVVPALHWLPAYATDIASPPLEGEVANEYVLWAGHVEPAREPAPSPDRTGLAFGVSAERRHASGMRYGLRASYLHTDYETPPQVVGGAITQVSPVMSLDLFGLEAHAALGLRVGRAEFYAGGGIGLYYSQMTAYATTAGTSTRREETDYGPGAGAFLGVEIATGRSSRFGVEARRVRLEANYGILSGGTMRVGGNSLLLTYRRSLADFGTP